MKRRFAKFAPFRIRIAERYGQPNNTDVILGRSLFDEHFLWLKSSNCQSCDHEDTFYHVIQLTVAKNQA